MHAIPKITVEFQHIPLIAKHFNQEVIVYDMTLEGLFILRGWVLGEEDEEDENPSMTTRVFNGLFNHRS